jgi:ABC-type uncharacterized transport system permease subunit
VWSGGAALAQAGAFRTFTVLGNGFFDLADLRSGKWAVVGFVLRQLFDGQIPFGESW